MSEIDDKADGYYWGCTKHLGVWRMLRKSTDKQTWGMPWKDMEDGKRITWHEIQDRYSGLVIVEKPVGTGK